MEADAEAATEWARGLVRMDDDGQLVPRDALLPDPDDADARSDAAASEASVGLDGSVVTAATVATAASRDLRVFLLECGLDPYANTSDGEMRGLAARLLADPAGALIAPAHPALHRHSRPALALRIEPRVIRGAELFDLLKDLADRGAVLDERMRDAFLPFENTRKRGRKLYDAGPLRKGERHTSHCHSLDLTAQRATFEPSGFAPVDAVVFRMAVHASMKGMDHVSMLALAMTTPPRLLAPNPSAPARLGRGSTLCAATCFSGADVRRAARAHTGVRQAAGAVGGSGMVARGLPSGDGSAEGRCEARVRRRHPRAE